MASCFSPRKRKLKDISLLVNEPRIVRTNSKTFSYGETPAAVCRRHFEEMASHFNVSLEKFAEDVLKGSLANQLLNLAEFYKSRDKESAAVFDPLVEQATKSNEESANQDSSISDNATKKSKRTTPEKRVKIVFSPKTQRKIYEPAQSTRQRNKNDDNIKPSSLEEITPAKLPRIIISANTEIAEPVEAIQSSDDCYEQAGAATSDKITHQIADDNTQEEISNNEGLVAEKRKETREELEAFLFGDVPYVPKTPPRKKNKKRTNFTTRDSPATSEERVVDSSSPCHVRPSLTFDPVKWSPSKQRDLLSIAKDIAKLQRSLQAGELPDEPVSKLVSFTKPND